MGIREELQEEINNTRSDFHALLDGIPVEAYDLPSDNPAWTVAQVLYHMSLAPRLLGSDVKVITGQNRLYRLIPIIVPRGLFDRLNVRVTRYGARHATPEFLAREYDRAHAATLKALAGVADADFGKHVFYPEWDPMLSGEVTLERLFHYVKAHFDSHAGQLRQIVGNLDHR